MVDTSGLIWPIQRRDDFFRIVAYIILATALIFVIDVITPLGVMIWILYLIPLFLTVYLSWKYAPLVMTGVFILIMAVSLFMSPRDISIEYALIDRVFFALILIVTSIFIENYVSNVECLAMNEERYRHLIEWLPEGIIVYQQGRIAYINPAGIRLLGSDRKDDLIGRDIIDMIDPGFRKLFLERVAQAALGARMDIDTVQLIRQDGSEMSIGMFLGTIFWDNGSAVQIVMRNA
ncbi:PAS domain-containing protein [Methanosphaerula palustris]|uniref:PAS sensor protein n=1 Tax=Methanosphaerula palustris (strain ATCC BAA-1556 / DSM 19958 / E1-9c) TaxID=521011 RepID=B8GJD6_METPE|nr:PAS domain S-box protein [Methanosphaerula palustris]ACL16977.1 PAS sensor protein [Methanosphaerula palustris E1-9c]